MHNDDAGGQLQRHLMKPCAGGRDLQFCPRRRFKVANGGLKVLIPGLCGSVLQGRYSPAGQCGAHTGQQWV